MTGFLAALKSGLAALLGFLAGKFQGYRLALERQKEANEQAERERDKLEQEVAKRPDNKLDKDMEKWFRD